jgi:hypothetical protein
VERNISIFTVGAHINELSAFIAKDIDPEFQRFGIEIANFNENESASPRKNKKNFKTSSARKWRLSKSAKLAWGKPTRRCEHLIR